MRTKYGFETTSTRSELMSKIKSNETISEIVFRKQIWKLGYRYRKNYSKLLGKPDIVFPSSKVAVFIDGDFWHGYKWSEKRKKIKNNKEYWITKIERNMKRDRLVNDTLRKSGWVVIRFWEHEIRTDLSGCVEKIVYLISQQIIH